MFIVHCTLCFIKDISHKYAMYFDYIQLPYSLFSFSLNLLVSLTPCGSFAPTLMAYICNRFYVSL